MRGGIAAPALALGMALAVALPAPAGAAVRAAPVAHAPAGALRG